MGIGIAGLEPMVLFLGNVRLVRLVSADANNTMLELGQASNDTFDTVKMSLTRTRAEAQKHHDSCSDVKSTNLDGPLAGSDVGLIDLNTGFG